MKCLLTLILILLQVLICVSLFSVSEATMIFLQIQPSSISRALGYGYNGVADIWHQSPFIAWDNPALPSLHEGLAVSYTKDNWLKNSGVEDLYFHSGMITFGYKGLGITLPSGNNYGELGTTIDYGVQEIMDEMGNTIGEFSSYETARCFSASYNLLSYLRQTTPDYPDWYNNFNLAAGISCIDIDSDLGPGTGATDADIDGSVNTQIFDVGLIMSYKDQLADNFTGEVSIGYKQFNLIDEHVSYINDEQKDPIGQNKIFGIGLGASVPLKNIVEEGNGLLNWTENCMTLRVLTSQNFSKIHSEVKSSGVEIGVFDTFYYRIGNFSDPDGEIKGTTSGFGLNLHYADVIALEFNSAEFPGGYLVDIQKSTDCMLMVDLIGVYQLIENN